MLRLEVVLEHFDLRPLELELVLRTRTGIRTKDLLLLEVVLPWEPLLEPLWAKVPLWSPFGVLELSLFCCFACVWHLPTSGSNKTVFVSTKGERSEQPSNTGERASNLLILKASGASKLSIEGSHREETDKPFLFFFF